MRRLSQQSGTRGLVFCGRWLGGQGGGGLGQFSSELLEIAPESLEITLANVLVERPFEELIGALDQRDDMVPLDVQEWLCDGAALDLVDHLLKLEQALSHASAMPRERSLLEPHTELRGRREGVLETAWQEE